MAVIGIELVDAAVVAVRDGNRVAASPGLALLEASGVAVGEAAAAQARLKPVLATDRFWSDLSAETFAQGAATPVSHAELGYAHLASLWRAIAQPGDSAVFALPGAMRLHQVGLLHGLARRAGIAVAGTVDAAVAACAGRAARGTVLHLDVQLHQAVLTELAGATVLRRRRVDVTPRAGLKAMYAAWAQLVAEAMVRRTRFDPLHQAATEQQLYERLPGWLEELARVESVDAVIETEAGSFAATLRREQLTLAVEAWYAQLAELVHAGHRADEPATLALSARAALLPALGERLAALPGLEPATLPLEAAAAGAAARAGEVGPAEPPTLVTALARAIPAASAARRRAAGARPTHVIQDGRAHAIGPQPLVVGAGAGPGRRLPLAAGAGISREHCALLAQDGEVLVRDTSRYGTWVNGERVEGEAVLAAGDRLRVGTPGVVLELVAVG
ncbi:MAG TPA: FHA domain-containing protein [Steroidobacteraceae bacterium]|nr:FHA domain-containing protein [Steroidobacteraceae bacterium]